MAANPQLLATSLVRPDDVFSASLEQLGPEVKAQQDKGEISSICNAASELINGFLDRTLFVHETTFFFTAGSWDKCPRLAWATERYAPQWPVTEVTGGENIDIGTARPGGQLLYSNASENEIGVLAGYIREDQVGANDAATLVTVNAFDQITFTATVVPPTLPDDIRQVALSLCIININKRLKGVEDGARRIHVVGGGAVTVEAADPNAVPKLLQSISHYRKIA